MTNMQHYMDDIQDLLEGLDEEMSKRLARMAKWEDMIAEKKSICERNEAIMFDETKSLTERTKAADELTETRFKIRDLAEKKTNLAEKNHLTVEKIYTRLNELAYHCKCEVEIDNPGCTEQRERAYYRSIDPLYYGGQNAHNRTALAEDQDNRRRREYSTMTEEDKASTRSVTPFNNRENPVKKRVGRPRNLKTREFEKFPGSSAVSSARSSIEPENPHSGVMIAEKRKRKRDSEYSRKKSRNRRLDKSLFEIKKEIDSNVYDNPILYDIDSSTGIVSRMAHSSTACVDIIEDDEQELLDCLKSSGLTQSPKGMMEDLEVSESALYSMEMYPPDHKSENAQSQSHNFRHPGNLSSHLGGTASSSQSFTQQRSNNATAAALAAASSVSDSSIEKRTQRNTLFGSIPETSFSGRHRKLTGRVTEMIIPQREKINPNKKHRGQDDWCICNGANTNSDMMVECENKDCPQEWFHFDCVGLTEPPENEWYCPNCSSLPDQSFSTLWHN